MGARRFRKDLLIEKDTEENVNVQDLAYIEGCLRSEKRLTALKLVPGEAFRYPEIPPKPEEVQQETKQQLDSSADPFLLDYDTITLQELVNFLPKITPSTVLLYRQEQESSQTIKRVKFDDSVIEYYLDSNHSLDILDPFLSLANASPESQKSDASDTGYTYKVMLNRLFEELNQHNESSARASRSKIPTPQLDSVGKKKTCIANFARICEALNRSVEDMKEFLELELSCKGSLDSKNALTIKYQMKKSNDLDNLLQKYMDVYVKCNSCHRIDTVLTKNGRLVELRCNICTATRTVSVESATYRANVEKRSIARAAITL